MGALGLILSFFPHYYLASLKRKKQLQNNLKQNKVVTKQDQINIFSYRSEIYEANNNFKGPKKDERCV